MIDLLAASLAIIVALLIIQVSLHYVGLSFAQNEGSANPGGIPFRWALKALIPIGFALFALQSLAMLLHALARLRAA